MSNNKFAASIVLATYDWPEALEMVLAALELQSNKNFEIVLADDGSDEKTKNIIKKFSNLQIKHFWQEHKGFRKSRILNQAISAATGEVLIFLDGDCVPHSEFVAQHILLASDSKSYVCGRRVDLSATFTKNLNVDKIRSGVLNGYSLLDYFHLWLDSVQKNGSTPFHRAYMVKNVFLRKIFRLDRVVDLKGCNFSVLRKHMLAIDGFDESYEGYGREDTDVEIRLQNFGLKIKSAKNLCLQFHLWHQPRWFTPANENLLEDARKSGRIKALRGITAGTSKDFQSIP